MIIYFRKTQINQVLSGLIAFCVFGGLMKGYIRYFIIFGITLVLTLIILFSNPFLGTYKNKMTIKYDEVEEGYRWEYKSKGNALKIIKEKDNEWVFKPNKTGKYEITYYYKNEEGTKVTIYYKFRVFGKRIFWMEGNAKGVLNYPNPY
jgi:energy-coupling factor transporter transmembrane protein EcfT